jgi:hypothetical protein
VSYAARAREQQTRRRRTTPDLVGKGFRKKKKIRTLGSVGKNRDWVVKRWPHHLFRDGGSTKMSTTIGGSQNDAINKISGIGESGGQRCAYIESSQCDRSIQDEQNIQSRSG